jgi:hypothetical protein
MLLAPTSKIRSRQIDARDVDAVANLLARGFALRTRGYWQRRSRSSPHIRRPPGFPKYGYLLESDGAPVGVILLIFSAVPSAAGTTIRCNVSSWYVGRMAA